MLKMKNRKHNAVQNTMLILLISIAFGFFVGSKLIRKIQKNVPLKCSGGFDEMFRSEMEREQYFQEFMKPKKLLYIGIMSAEKNLDSRVRAAMETWSKHHNGVTIEIFAGNNGQLTAFGTRVTTLDNGVQVIQLPGVSDTAYPPQKKSFSMVKYMHDHHLNDFDWFLRLDDDAYLKIDQLEKFLSKVNSSKPFFIGQPGYGRDAEDYVGVNENYCMGGTGAIFSRALLREVGPKLRGCLHNLFTEHEDIELGRCVQRSVGVKCTSAWDTNVFFYQNYAKVANEEARNIDFISIFKREHALILHSNKNSEYQNKLHRDVLGDKVRQLLLKTEKLKRDIDEVNKEIMQPLDDESELQELLEENRRGIWNWMSKVGDLSKTSFGQQEIPRDMTMYAVEQNIEQVNWNMRHPMKKNQPLVVAGEVTKLYNKISALKGLEAKAYVKTRHSKTIYRYCVEQNLMKNVTFFMEDVDLKKHLGIRRNNEEDTVYFILTLSGRPTTFIRFLNNFEDLFLTNHENVALIITRFQSDESRDTQVVENAVKYVRTVYPWLHIEIIEDDRSFSRGLGLQVGADAVTTKNTSILFFVDVDMLMQKNLLNTIRRNTVRGKTAYYPMVFGEYDHMKSYRHSVAPTGHFDLDERSGFWRTFSYGMVAIYKDDFNKCDGFDLSIRGWGMEDVKLITTIQNSGLRIFRSNEPSLVHVYHDKVCDETNQQISCYNSRAQQFAPTVVLADLWFKTNDDN